MSPVPPLAAGWHPDPGEPALLRYWDGSGWTPHTASGGSSTAEAHRTMPFPPHRGRHAPTPPGDDRAEHTTVPDRPPPAGEEVARPHGLAVAGAITAAVSLVVACAALGVALAS
ncbi:hypothetical protein GCM10009819_21070 [Agromyces tropicus]|uniref:DUF2510 domain-containing protein n=1 Tax=Agromyces tropicus TaxID=555371 RepID=A0ABN2UFS1_9MICO